jgi:hypothetical protein
LTKRETTVIPQAPYSPDLVPADFISFPRLKCALKGRRFQTIATGRTRYPAKLEEKENFGSGVQAVKGSALNETGCKLIDKCFKIK